MHRTALFVTLFALLIVVAVGCGRSDAPPMAKVSGTVTYNGTPLEGANVVFAPDAGPAAYGTTGPDGKFILSTRGQDGAMVGPGKVAVTAVEPFEEKPEEELTDEDIAAMNKSLIPVKYGNPQTSGISFTVSGDGENNLPIELTD